MCRAIVKGLALLVACSPALGAGEVPATPTSPRAQARSRFEDAKFGLFLHWGVYSLLGKGEWVMNSEKLPAAEYEKLPPRFHPTKFDAETWADAAKAAGARYITVTAKGHDGFCMFQSALTTYDVVDATPFGRDPLKALADACRARGIGIFFYYSLLDWHHPDYFPRGDSGKHSGRPERGDWKAYVAYTQGQLRELCTNYGEISGIWLDGQSDRKEADWGLETTYRLIHELQPGALIGNNHHLRPLDGEDFQIFERELPGRDALGINKAEVADGMPLETCLTLNNSWGFNARDKAFKAPDRVIRSLVLAAGSGANLLLGVGPGPDGAIGPEATVRLAAVGKWLDGHGQSLYGTRRGPIAPQEWGVSTSKSGVVYLHALKPEARLPIPETLAAFEARAGGAALPFGRDEEGPFLRIPEGTRSAPDTVLILRPTGFGR